MGWHISHAYDYVKKTRNLLANKNDAVPLFVRYALNRKHNS